MKRIVTFCCGILWFYTANSQTVQANVVTLNPDDKFTYDSQDMPHYGLKWPIDSWYTGGNSAWLSGYAGIKLFTFGQPRLAINPSGNIGIGTINPGFKLTVMGDSYANGYVYSDMSTNEGGALSLLNSLKTGANVNRWTIYNMTGQYGNALKFWRYSADLTNTGPQFILDDNGSSAFTGRLGIGTMVPAADLHVGQRLINTPPSSDVSVARVAIQPYYHTGGPWFIDSRDNNEKAYLDIRYGEQKIYTIDHLGNIGVGMQSPTEKFCVNGNIRSRKVIVTQTGWPDYVFDSSYQLPSLDSVSTFIQTNKHLPDMPAAATVEKDGHDLGEVQKMLLKKVEELTLYVIALQKENKTMADKIELQQKQIEALKPSEKK